MDKPDPDILPPSPTGWAGRKIGLLGGSFNPAHSAHLEISQAALDRLGLDAVWWLVSPQNPLKSADEMAPLNHRMDSARAAASDKRIHVSDLEHHLGTSYTADTVQQLTRLCPDSHFVWLMGADNLAQFCQWRDWQTIARTVVFAIFNRPGYSGAVETSEAARHFQDTQIPAQDARNLATMSPPAWTFIRETQNPLSSTEMRRKSV
ncbi:nicotinate-nucleotide adenylyltransferase [Paremcibacter congregatus]|uniref:nicotinate-nucleotide adenylyltransferase n=1 Tax=Paremcibacter congregatus TaxID=2043170 RepID=UPI003A8D7DDF